MDDNADSGLTPALELLWGLRERPRRGPKPGLSLDRIVTAGIRIADGDGLAPLSMSRVADELGFTTMSLYRYVASKDELLALMADTAVGVPGELDPDERDWRRGLARWCHEIFAVYQRHPWVLQIPITGPPLGPGVLAWLENGLAVLAHTGLDDAERISVIQMIGGFVRNEAQLINDLRRGAELAAGPAGTAPPSYGSMLRRLVDARRYPQLHRIASTGAFDDGGGYSGEDFEFGLRRILDGIAILVDSRATG